MSGLREFVKPRWGTRRRTRDEWLALGGDPAVRDATNVDLWPSLGHEIADVARRLELPPMPHQRYIFDVAGELDPEDARYLWYTEADVWVMRQCGKTMGIIFPIIVHRLTRMPKRIGKRQRASFTMQDRQETRKKFEIDMIPQLVDASESFHRIDNPKGRPGRSTREWKSSLNNGSEHLLFGQGNYMMIDTPSEKAGHGGTLDLKAADEVRFGVDDRIEASAGPSQITRKSRQLVVASTAGDEKSFYMWPKVVAGRRRIERADTETRVCSFEYAIPEDADLHNPETWYEFHPAADRTIAVRDLLDEVRKAEDSPDETKVDTLRQEHGNQWVRHPVIGDAPREYVIDPTVWALAAVNARTPFLRPITIGVGVSDDGRSGSIVMAGWNPNGQAQVKVLELEAGTFWLGAALANAVFEHQPAVVTYDAGGPTKSIAGPIARACGTVDVEPITGADYTGACSAFVNGFREGRYRHLDQGWLNTAVDGAQKKQRGEKWLWDLQTSLADIAPLTAATTALRALEGRPPERRSAYEDGELQTV